MEQPHDTDLRGRVVQLERGETDHSRRLGVLEEWRRQRDIDEARRSTEWKAFTERIDDRFLSFETRITERVSGVADDIKSIRTPLMRIAILIISGFVLTLMGLAWKSGFSIHP